MNPWSSFKTKSCYNAHFSLVCIAENLTLNKKRVKKVPKQWYVIRVQSNREEMASTALRRNVEAGGLEEVVTNVMVPTQQVAEIRNGKRRQVEKKLYPGYILIEVEMGEDGEIPDAVSFLLKETEGVGDFVGGGEPAPLSNEEVSRLIGHAEEEQEEEPTLEIEFKEGDMVEIKEGPFHDMKGHVEEVNATTGRVKVVINVFNRPTPVDLNYWQVELT